MASKETPAALRLEPEKDVTKAGPAVLQRQMSVPLIPRSPTIQEPAASKDDGEKYVCKLQRKRSSSVRRKRVLAAVDSDNKPVHIPLIEYGDQHDVYETMAERLMLGNDVTTSIRALREKLGMLRAIRDACSQKIDTRLKREYRIRTRIEMKRTFVLWTYTFTLFIFITIGLKIFYVLAKLYFGCIIDHINHFRSGNPDPQ